MWCYAKKCKNYQEEKANPDQVRCWCDKIKYIDRYGRCPEAISVRDTSDPCDMICGSNGFDIICEQDCETKKKYEKEKGLEAAHDFGEGSV
jgi:hypothetical protein